MMKNRRSTTSDRKQVLFRIPGQLVEGRSILNNTEPSLSSAAHPLMFVAEPRDTHNDNLSE